MLYSPSISYLLFDTSTELHQQSKSRYLLCVATRLWRSSSCLFQHFFTATFSLCCAVRQLQLKLRAELWTFAFKDKTCSSEPALVRTFQTSIRCYSTESLWFSEVFSHPPPLMWQFYLAFTNLYVVFALEQKCPSVWYCYLLNNLQWSVQ